MKRVIKFRARSLYDGNQWVYGLLFKSGSEGQWTEIQTENGQSVYVVPETISQFTGLYDSTTWNELSEEERSKWTLDGNFPSEWVGREIYESDILRPKNNEKRFYAVVWKGEGFCRRYKFIQKYLGEEWEEMTYIPVYPDAHKVVGNIYEDDHLLGVRE